MDEVKTFSEWRRENGIKSREALVMDMAIDGYTHEEIDAEWDRTLDEYEDYCEENGFEQDMDE